MQRLTYTKFSFEISQTGRPKKKSAWTDLDQVPFENFCRDPPVKFGKSAWTGLEQAKTKLGNLSL